VLKHQNRATAPGFLYRQKHPLIGRGVLSARGQGILGL